MDETPELSCKELKAALDALLPGRTDGLLSLPPRLASQQSRAWLAWAKSSSKVKVSSWPVPPGILPPGTSATIHDAKVESRPGRPDDKIYNSDAEIREKVARGNTVLELYTAGADTAEFDMAVFALKKFTGGMGDEDEEQPEDEQVWQQYFLRPLTEVRRVVCMLKENGEAAHVSVRLLEGKFFFIAGSKNVHLVFRSATDLALYTDSRYNIARRVGSAWLAQLARLNPAQRTATLNLLASTGLTAVWEILLPDYQHVVDLSHLTQPGLKFLSLTGQYRESSEELLTSYTGLPPDLCLDLATALGLDTVKYETVAAEEAEARMAVVRVGRGYEGEVLYFLDQQDCTVGLLKKKTAWYVVLRAIREKAAAAQAVQRKGGWGERAGREAVVRLDRRLGEIQRWLGLQEEETEHWRLLGRQFLLWLLSRSQADTKNNVRGNFPQLWREFTALKHTDANGATLELEVIVAGEWEELQDSLEEPRDGSPSVTVTRAVLALRPHIAVCIIRRLDLTGRNLKRLLAALTKLHNRTCRGRELATVGLHDLASLPALDLLYSAEQSPALTPIGAAAPAPAPAILKSSLDSVVKYRHLVASQEVFPFLSAGQTVVSLPPLLNCEETKLSESTENILVEITSDHGEAAVQEVMAALLKQIYHLSITLGSTHKSKCLQVEKGKVVKPDGTKMLLPQQICWTQKFEN